MSVPTSSLPTMGAQRRFWRCAGAGMALAAALCGTAHALVVVVTDTGSYAVSLQVGSAAAIDNVSFAVAGANVGSSSAVVGTPGVAVSVVPTRPFNLFEAARPVTLSVNSSAQLLCQAGTGCGSTAIPFSKISWTVSNNSASGDIQPGSFNGSATQPIAVFNANAGLGLCSVFFCALTNTLDATRLVFSYANDTVYPAGSYRGRVVFTASME